ncbi:MAG: META domain-containing protein [Bacteroidota bacterium]
MTRTSLLLVALLLSTTGCDTEAVEADVASWTLATSVTDLQNTDWRLVRIETADGRTIEAGTSRDDGLRPSLAFGSQANDGVLSYGGFSGCNVFGGEYAIEDEGRVRFDGPISTLIYCEDTGEQERITFDVLNGEARVDLSRDSDGVESLRIQRAGHGTLIYTDNTTDTDAELLGDSWRIVRVEPAEGSPVEIISNGEEPASITFTTEPNLNGAGLEFTGYTGCNSMFGSYTRVVNDGLLISGVGATERACAPQTIMTAEAVLLNTLPGTVRVTFGSSNLTLEGSAGKVILTRD